VALSFFSALILATTISTATVPDNLSWTGQVTIPIPISADPVVICAFEAPPMTARDIPGALVWVERPALREADRISPAPEKAIGRDALSHDRESREVIAAREVASRSRR
jgi:hypothetical protein